MRLSRRRPAWPQRTLTTTLSAGLLAFSLTLPLSVAPTPARAQALSAGLAARDRAAVVALWPAVQRCRTGLTTVTGDLQQASAKLNAGQRDPGRLGPDARQMRNACLAAAARVNRLHFAAGARHTAARRVKAELHAALVDLAEGASDCMQIAHDIAGDDVGDAVDLLQRGESAWYDAEAHLRVVTTINPLHRMLQRLGAGADLVNSIEDYAAVVPFWARQSHLAQDLDRRLLHLLLGWLADAWAFSNLTFMANSSQTRHLRIIEEAGFPRLYTVDADGEPHAFFIYGQSD